IFASNGPKKRFSPTSSYLKFLIFILFHLPLQIVVEITVTIKFHPEDLNVDFHSGYSLSPQESLTFHSNQLKRL
ncbi:hypothetical protein, partial [Peribacillus frigoritolerans]|uniref:hypothetical protein n=1 Tax=Peribacillus frigoritolerans TaxID=450367 RepID=UPI001E3CA944